MSLFLGIILNIFIYIFSQDYSIRDNNIFFDKVNQIRKNINIPSFNDIFDKFFYAKSDLLKLTVKTMHSSVNQIPYDYTFLELCNPT